MLSKIYLSTITLASAAILSSCVPAAIFGGAAAVGYTIAQERSVGDAIDDIAIETEVNALLLAQEDKNLFLNVDIDSVEGRVLLTGSVPTRRAKVDAYKTAWRPDSVKEVINEITVDKDNSQYSAKKIASDTWISAQIESKLLFARNVSSINYSIETIDGNVYLMGVAKDKEELKNVAEIASTVSGVKKVVSHVRIKDKEYPSTTPNPTSNKKDVNFAQHPTYQQPRKVVEEEIEGLDEQY